MAEWIVEITDGLPHLKNMKPLVRCKDCKWYDLHKEYCLMHGYEPDCFWFCADGERKEQRDGET